jgi:hypothetical protein
VHHHLACIGWELPGCFLVSLKACALHWRPMQFAGESADQDAAVDAVSACAFVLYDSTLSLAKRWSLDPRLTKCDESSICECHNAILFHVFPQPAACFCEAMANNGQQ